MSRREVSKFEAFRNPTCEKFSVADEALLKQ